jgi:hypothetical protein
MKRAKSGTMYSNTYFMKVICSFYLKILICYFKYTSDEKLNLLIWNVRGLNERNKKTIINKYIQQLKSHIIIMQTTKV